MYAIIADGGRQYKVEEGLELELDYRDVPSGEQLTFDHVLAISGTDGLQLGTPRVEGASVMAEVLGPALGKKLIVQKFRRRKNSRRRTGHRQMYTLVRISHILPDAAAAEKIAASQSDAPPESDAPRESDAPPLATDSAPADAPASDT